MKPWWMMAVVIMALAAASCSKSYSGRGKPVAVRGTMDLREWDFSRDGAVDLSGDWKFVWGRLVRCNEPDADGPQEEYAEVPGIWNGHIAAGRVLGGDGCATYRLKVLLPHRDGAAGGEKLAVKVQDLGTSYVLFINGLPVAAGGVAGESPDVATPGYWPDVVEAGAVSGEMDIVLHVSNYHHRKGGAWEPVVLGLLPVLRDMREKNLARDFFLFGSIFIMGAYHLVLFCLRKKDRSYLYFGIFCMLIALRVLVTGEYFAVRLAPRLPWEGILKIEYLSFYAGVPVFFLFVHSLFPGEFSKKVLACTVAAGIIFCGAVIAVPPRYYTHTMRPYQGLSAGICVYGLCVLVKAIVRKREGSIPFISGFIIMFIAVLNDFLHNNMVIRTGYLVPCGLLLFIVLQAFLLSRRFSRTLGAVEHLTGELEEKNRKLLDMDQMRDEFLATVSHELRTPLNGIMGIAESLVDGRSGPQSLEAKFNLGLMIASARRLAALVNDLLDFARLKNCDIILNRGPVDIKSLGDVVLSFIRPLVGAKNLALINAIPADSPPAYADEDRVQQVLYNLVGNAVKFTGSGSVVLDARISGREGWVEISISDTGTGINPEALTGIRTGDQGNEKSGSAGGAGMGLVISRKLVELHGGMIRAEAAHGGGSVFTFTLPVWPEGRDEKNAEIAAPGKALAFHACRLQGNEAKILTGAPVRGRILVVDDDIVNLQVMRNHLSGDGYTVDFVSSGTAALDMMRQRSYDLLVLDLMMPGMSGLDLCKEVRRRFSLVELPVAILTARYGLAELVAGFENGANDYLTKPVRREELLARVRNLVVLKKAVQDHDEARYKLLQERMNPHFLFNSLNTVHALINRDRSRADQAVIMLADNYRFLIDYSFLSLIPFDAEWRFVENYLELEGLRFRDTITASMERRGDFSSIRIPPLTIQPLVENALKHGIRQNGSRGRIRVEAETDGGLTRLIVADNGAGPGDGDLFSRSLGNIRKRLNHYYHNVELTVDRGETGGALVRLSFVSSNEKIACMMEY